MANAKRKSTTAEGRVNVPLGTRKNELSIAARAGGTTETSMARTLIFFCLDKLKKGEIKFRGPSVTTTAEAP
jgi:hypothetical protein